VATSLSVLLLEDNPDDADLIVYELRRAGFQPTWQRVDSRDGFRAALSTSDGPPEILLADYSLPQFNALDALQLLSDGGYDIPTIVVSGAMSEEACVDALRHGAVDYLLKDRLTRLGSAVEHALAQKGILALSREHERRFLAAFDHAPVGMAVTDLDGRILEANRRLSQLSCAEPGARIVDMVCAEDRGLIEAYLERVVGGETDLEDPEVRLLPDGTWGQYSACLTGGVPPHIVHQIADVTDRRNAEQALERTIDALARTNTELQELDRLKDEFIATVSHELRTPLTSIRGYTEILTDDPELDGAHRSIIAIIDRNGQRLMELIEDLLTFSNIESGTLQLARGPVKARQIVEAAADAIRPSVEAAGLSLDVVLEDSLPIVDGDLSQLERVLLNLLTNAVKFSREGGVVTMKAVHEGPDVVFQIVDTGVGIPAHEQAMLFNRFYRTKDAQKRAIKGSGLGLAISKAIIEAHGGSITLASREGAGTTVTFTVPAFS
jgi:PAS domain S-box-containing protein